MAESVVLSYKDFDVNDIRFTNMSVVNQKMKKVGLELKTGRKLKFFTPVMTTYGFSDYEDNRKFKLGLNFDANAYINEDGRALRDMLFAIQEKIKTQAISETWFAPKVVKTMDSVENIFSNMISYAKDKNTGVPDPEKAVYFNLKLSEYNEAFNVKVYNNRRQELYPNLDAATVCGLQDMDLSSPPLSLLPSNTKTQVRVLFEISYLWFISGRFGVICNVNEVIIHKAFQPQLGCSIPLDPTLDCDDDENETQQRKRTSGRKRELTVADSDNDDDDDDLEEGLNRAVARSKSVIVSEVKTELDASNKPVETTKLVTETMFVKAEEDGGSSVEGSVEGSAEAAAASSTVTAVASAVSDLVAASGGGGGGGGDVATEDDEVSTSLPSSPAVACNEPKKRRVAKKADSSASASASTA